MGTPFSEIIDLALILIQDYKLDRLYDKSPTDWETFLSGFIVQSVPLFTESKIELGYDINTKTFNNELGIQEKHILSNLVVYVWFKREVNNVSQFSNTMTPNDFKRYSEAQNLKAKSEYLDKNREEYSQLISNYGYNNVDWNSWASGDFL